NVGKVKGYFELQNKDLEELQKTGDEIKKSVQDFDKKQYQLMIKMGAFYTGVLIVAMVVREAIK
ncbi:MAG: hypothetical protein IH884_12790, partial [Myxococcales bacterium]|nr:hypothetical protein [Myxococcales bacterium]